MTLVIHLPEDVERKLRARAIAEGKTIDQVAAEALSALTDAPIGAKTSDFSGVVGTWVEDPIYDQIRREHDQIDADLWK